MARALADLSPAEVAAMRSIKAAGSLLITRIPEQTEKDVFGDPVPGVKIYKRLEARGLCFQTIEDPVRFTDDPDEEPFYFTESIEFTDEGLELAYKLKFAIRGTASE